MERQSSCWLITVPSKRSSCPLQAHRIVEHVGSRCRVLVNGAYGSTNSIVSLHCARDAVRGEAFLFQNGDVLYSPELMRRFVAAPPRNGCLVDPQRPFFEGEYHVELDQGRIIRYSRDVPHERSVGESAQLVKIGAASSAAFLDRIGGVIDRGGHQGFPNQAYDVLMAGEGFWPVYTAGLPWREIDTPEDLPCNCDFIRGDHDLDLGIPEAEFDRLPALREAMLGHGFRVRIESRYKLSFVHPRHPHLLIDLDVIRPHRDGWAITNADSDPARLFHYRFPQAVFADSRAMRLAGIGDVLVPADPEGFLTAVYGDWSRPQSKTDYLYGPLNLEVECRAPTTSS